MSNQTEALRSCASRYHYPALLQRLRDAESEGRLEEQLQHEYTRNRRRVSSVHFGASPSFVHRYCNSTGKQALQFLTWTGIAEMPSCCPLGHEWTLEPHGGVLYWKCHHRLPGVRVARTTAELQALKDRAVNRPGPRPRACITFDGGRCGWSGKTGAYMGQTQI